MQTSLQRSGTIVPGSRTAAACCVSPVEARALILAVPRARHKLCSCRRPAGNINPPVRCWQRHCIVSLPKRVAMHHLHDPPSRQHCQHAVYRCRRKVQQIRLRLPLRYLPASSLPMQQQLQWQPTRNIVSQCEWLHCQACVTVPPRRRFAGRHSTAATGWGGQSSTSHRRRQH